MHMNHTSHIDTEIEYFYSVLAISKYLHILKKGLITLPMYMLCEPPHMLNMLKNSYSADILVSRKIKYIQDKETIGQVHRTFFLHFINFLLESTGLAGHNSP